MKARKWKKLYGLSVTFTCPYCLKELPYKYATRDHAIPRSRGGRTVGDNVVLCCERCNKEKGALTPEEYAEWKRLGFIRTGGLSRTNQSK